MSKSDDRKRRKRDAHIKVKRARDAVLAAESQLQRTLQTANQLSPQLISDVLAVPWPKSQQLISIALTRSPLRDELMPDAFPPDIFSFGIKRSYGLTANLNSELQLILSVLITFKRQLQLFLSSFGRFERSVLLGDLPAARSERATVIGTHGTSMWSIETGLLLGELEQGVKGSREALSEVQEATKSPYVGLLSSFMSLRIEAMESVSGYTAALRSLLAPARYETKLQSLIAETVFRLNLHDFQQHRHLHAILELSRGYSLCDAYNTFVRVLLVMASHPHNVAYKQMLSTVVPKAAEAFDDHRLWTLLALTDAQSDLHVDALSDSLFFLCDQYARGDYASVLSGATGMLSQYPHCFELYELAARASANGQLAVPECLPQPSVSATLLAAC